jgi:hypothetical protein
MTSETNAGMPAEAGTPDPRPRRGRRAKTDAPNPKPKITLLTNINFIRHGDFRFECHALLIEENHKSLFEPVTQIRGFGTTGCAPTFTRWMKVGVQFALDDADSRQSAVMIGESGNARPIFQGCMLRFDDGQEYFLQIHNERFPLDLVDVTQYERDYLRIWDILEQKVEEYWPEHQRMPRNDWGPPLRRKKTAGGTQ